MENEKGFTLIEVVASIIIISIVLLSFSQLFIQSNKSSVQNNDKLITINLAEAELERLKVTPFHPDYLPPIDKSKLYNPPKKEVEKVIYEYGPKYKLSIKATQTADEKNNQLVNVVVTTKLNTVSTTVEGYVKYE